jgi:hypothetical protein
MLKLLQPWRWKQYVPSKLLSAYKSIPRYDPEDQHDDDDDDDNNNNNNNNNNKLNQEVQTDREVLANRPDIIVKNKNLLTDWCSNTVK